MCLYLNSVIVRNVLDECFIFIIHSAAHLRGDLKEEENEEVRRGRNTIGPAEFATRAGGI